MMRIQVNELIAAPVAKAFDAFTDIPATKDRLRAVHAIEVLDGTAPAKGYRWRETRTVLGRRATETMEITEHVPGVTFTVASHAHGTDFATVFRFKAEGDRTRVELDFTAVPKTVAAKAMAPLAKAMLPTMEKCFRDDLADMKTFLETGASAKG